MPGTMVMQGIYSDNPDVVKQLTFLGDLIRVGLNTPRIDG